MKYLFPLFAALAIVMDSSHAQGAAAPVTIALIGDSTVCNYSSESPLRGWGQLLPEFLTPDVNVMNEAISGKSTKTFPAASWQKILAAKPAYVLIQFGHNDMHAAERPESTNLEEYADNLRRYVNEARANDIQPILVTPVSRRTFRNDVFNDTLKPRADAMKAVASELSVPLIDLHASSAALFRRLGEAGSEAFTRNLIGLKEKDEKDVTHFTETGAREMARLVVVELVQAVPTLKARVKL